VNFIDLFAGAGGLSEGFTRAGFTPVAHVESNTAACFTIKTRLAYYHLKANDQIEVYYSYLKGQINRKELYKHIPDEILDSVINEKIAPETNDAIFEKIDLLTGDNEIDLIVGGPPCQAYSITGRGALKHKINDPRKQLYKEYGKYLIKYRPKLFVFENVPGLKSSDGGKHYNDLKEYFKSIGYTIDERQLNSWNFGVIQHRERLIIMGWREDVNFEFPNFDIDTTTRSSDDLFGDLPPLRPNQGGRWCNYLTPANEYLNSANIRNGVDFTTLHVTRPHNEKDLNIYRMAIEQMANGKRIKNDEIAEEFRTQKNTTDFLDRFKVVDKVPHTMIAHIANDGHHFIHPNISQLRSISVREAARIQSFPDNFYFEGVKEKGNRTAAFRQIGNAVPPLMAEKIAISIKNHMNEQ
jgi:DNA (cytosine-5)-methyltransferase 1